MPSYQTNEAQFDVPDGWEDQTLVAFASPGGLPKIGLVVTKHPLPSDMTPEAVIETQMRVSAQRLRRYELLEQKPRIVGTLKATDARFTHVHEGIALYQRQVFVHYFDQLWILTTSAPLARRAEAEETSDKLLASIKFRRPATKP